MVQGNSVIISIYGELQKFTVTEIESTCGPSDSDQKKENSFPQQDDDSEREGRRGRDEEGGRQTRGEDERRIRRGRERSRDGDRDKDGYEDEEGREERNENEADSDTEVEGETHMRPKIFLVTYDTVLEVTTKLDHPQIQLQVSQLKEKASDPPKVPPPSLSPSLPPSLLSICSALTLSKASDLSYSSIGGLGPQLAIVREIIELPLKHPDIFSHFGLNPPRGKPSLFHSLRFPSHYLDF